jgi:hypothetical protein
LQRENNVREDYAAFHTHTSLHIDSARAQAIIDTVSANRRDPPRGSRSRVTLLPVLTYVSEAKEGTSGQALVAPQAPPFASHWGIVVGDLDDEATLLHLVLRDDGTGAGREIVLAANSVDAQSKRIVEGNVTYVGDTKYEYLELRRIGKEMIKAFGNYHLVFWNCQMFAKCYLQVITGNDAAFTQWTSADITNLFLCALVVPIPAASSLKSREKARMKQLHDVGLATAALAELQRERGDVPTEEEVFKASDAVIDLMRASCLDDVVLGSLARPIKDSADKVGLMGSIRAFIKSAVPF